MQIKDLITAWNERKIAVHSKKRLARPKVRDVRICKIGINVGNEQNGDVNNFSRPVLVIHKFNNKMYWVVPLSTKQKDIDFYYNFTDKHGREVSAILAQMRLVSVQRFERFLYKMPKEQFNDIIDLLKRFLISE